MIVILIDDVRALAQKRFWQNAQNKFYSVTYGAKRCGCNIRVSRNWLASGVGASAHHPFFLSRVWGYKSWMESGRRACRQKSSNRAWPNQNAQRGWRNFQTSKRKDKGQRVGAVAWKARRLCSSRRPWSACTKRLNTSSITATKTIACTKSLSLPAGYFRALRCVSRFMDN